MVAWGRQGPASQCAPGLLTCGMRGAQSRPADFSSPALRHTVVPPRSPPRLSGLGWALQQQLGGSDCRLLRGGVGGLASRAQGAAIWSPAAGGARGLGTGPACGTRGQGQRPARGSSAWLAAAPCGLRAGSGRGRACMGKVWLLGGSELGPPQVAQIRGIPPGVDVAEALRTI